MLLRAFLPAIFISITSLLCPNLKNSASNVPFRPPKIVFMIVWPILYITTGIAWHLSKQDKLFTFLIAQCCLWLVFYSCKKLKYEAAYILIFSALTSWYIYFRLDKYISNYILPIAIWLTFATSINIYEVY